MNDGLRRCWMKRRLTVTSAAVRASSIAPPVSGWIHDVLAAGDRVHLSGPYGTFVGDPAQSGPVLCLAGGSGLAPILALADAALRRGYADPVTLLFSARTEDHLLAHGLLAHWQAQYQNFRLVTTLTRSQAGGRLHGRIPDVLHEVVADLSSHQVFVAGSPSSWTPA